MKTYNDKIKEIFPCVKYLYLLINLIYRKL